MNGCRIFVYCSDFYKKQNTKPLKNLFMVFEEFLGLSILLELIFLAFALLYALIRFWKPFPSLASWTIIQSLPQAAIDSGESLIIGERRSPPQF
jgi:hypothetical protein